MVILGADHGGFELKERIKKRQDRQDTQEFVKRFQVLLKLPDFAFTEVSKIYMHRLLTIQPARLWFLLQLLTQISRLTTAAIRKLLKRLECPLQRKLLMQTSRKLFLTEADTFSTAELQKLLQVLVKAVWTSKITKNEFILQ